MTAQIINLQIYKITGKRPASGEYSNDNSDKWTDKVVGRALEIKNGK